MWETVFNFLICLLAIYGALVLVSSILGGMQNRKNQEKSNIRVILMVKNNEEIIEGVIKNVFRQELLSNLATDGKLVVIDMGSSDKTWDILLRLKNYYMNMVIIDKKDKEILFT